MCAIFPKLCVIHQKVKNIFWHFECFPCFRTQPLFGLLFKNPCSVTIGLPCTCQDLSKISVGQLPLSKQKKKKKILNAAKVVFIA